MAKGRIKKYVQAAIPPKFSEKGGFSARFMSDGFSVDAKTEILPQVIEKEGLQIGIEPGWALVRGFVKGCADHVARTGETVNVDGLMTFGLAIRGWFAKKTSKATKENVHVTCKLLGDLRPTCNFSMSNANEGNTLTLITVMSPNCKLDEVVQGATARINGKWVKLIDDGTDADYVLAEAKNADGEPVSVRCAVTGSDDDHIDLVVPSAFNAPQYAGKPITFTVFGRTGDPEAGTQSASIEATLLDGGEEVRPHLDEVVTEGKTGVVKGQAFVAKGGRFPAWGEGSTARVKWSEDGEEKELELTPTATTDTAISFAAVPAMSEIPDNTELLFELEWSDGQGAAKESVLLAE